MTRTGSGRSGGPEKNTIVLVGLMGAGKSTIGQRLAKRLGMKFVDADGEIEKAAGCTVEDIFALHGESAFRDGEQRVIARLLEGPAHVLATGGGAFLNAATRESIKQRAVSVWLRADLDTLVRRVKRGSERPLLKNGEPREILAGLMKAREPIYASADLVVDSGDGPAENVVDQIVANLASVPRRQERHGGRARHRTGTAKPPDPKQSRTGHDA
jgi:shikimate kinase